MLQSVFLISRLLLASPGGSVWQTRSEVNGTSPSLISLTPGSSPFDNRRAPYGQSRGLKTLTVSVTVKSKILKRPLKFSVYVSDHRHFQNTPLRQNCPSETWWLYCKLTFARRWTAVSSETKKTFPTGGKLKTQDDKGEGMYSALRGSSLSSRRK